MTYSSVQEAAAIVGEIELYEFYFPHLASPEYYSSGHRNVTLPALSTLNPDAVSHTYVSIPISRQEIESQHNLSAPSRTRLTLPTRQTNFQDILIDGGLGPVDVKIIRGFGDPLANPENFQRYWYIGQLRDIQVEDIVVVGNLADQSAKLNQLQIPTYDLSRSCSHFLYGQGTVACNLSRKLHTFQFEVDAVLNNGKTLRVTPDNPTTSKYDIGDDNFSDPKIVGYFTFGRIYEAVTAAEDVDPITPAWIIGHTYTSGDSFCTLHLHTPLRDVLATDIVQATWGCDKRIVETCIPKFDNRENAFAAPKINTVDPTRTILFNKSAFGK